LAAERESTPAGHGRWRLPKWGPPPNHPLDLHRILSPTAQSSRDRETTHRPAGVSAQSGPHPLRKATRRDAELPLPGGGV